MIHINLLAIDIAKINFQLHGVDSKGNVILRKKLTRKKLVEFITGLPSCIIVMESWVQLHNGRKCLIDFEICWKNQGFVEFINNKSLV